ncbi:alpha/beta hydrolase [Paenibacillus glycanilyticus]|uniref:alpha/beta hydrolase n=1 Tax=Paenibacillus glycanilyticus TaxID=126569 RepID=UPI00203BCA68|nr:alpha/beta hydrolase [Paenibacillus glycanilyticus]MCM3628500.1 alpha/beta hydrolase [Paenibacillus glycanilyticus]
MPSSWGIQLLQKYVKREGQSKRLAVLFPGQNYSCELPLLHYAGKTALQSGYDIVLLEYGHQAARTSLDIQSLTRLIEESYQSIQHLLPQYEHVVFVSKSLGTVVAGEVHKMLQREIRHIFLTPLERTIPYLNTYDRIVIYGDKDEWFNWDAAEQMEDNRGVYVIPKANHGLETGDVEEHLGILSFVVQRYKEFFIRDSY